jgi:Predicted hydrolases of HD superfamily
LSETVADHSFLTAYVCMDLISRLNDPNVNLEKTVTYAIIHDIGEAYIGDVVKTASSRLGDIKTQIELEVVENEIDNNIVKKLYREYVESENKEALLAKLCNYVATYIKGVEYMKIGYRVNDILETTYAEIKELSTKLGIWDTVSKLMNEDSRNDV